MRTRHKLPSYTMNWICCPRTLAITCCYSRKKMELGQGHGSPDVTNVVDKLRAFTAIVKRWPGSRISWFCNASALSGAAKPSTNAKSFCNINLHCKSTLDERILYILSRKSRSEDQKKCMQNFADRTYTLWTSLTTVEIQLQNHYKPKSTRDDTVEDKVDEVHKKVELVTRILQVDKYVVCNNLLANLFCTKRRRQTESLEDRLFKSSSFKLKEPL